MKDKKKRKKKRNGGRKDKPISLYPLKPEEIIKKLLKIKPPKKEKGK